MTGLMQTFWARVGALTLLIAALYLSLLTWWVGPLNAFWSTDQGVKLIQVQSLVLNKYRSNAVQYPGQALDPERAFSPLRGQYLDYQGQTFAMFSQPFAAISGLPYFAFGYLGLYLVPLLAGALLVAACAPLAHQLLGSVALTLLALGIIGVTSPVIFYSLIFWEHTPAALLVLLGVWQAGVALQHANTRAALLAGMCCGLSAWLRNESVLAIIALGLALLLAQRPLRWRTAIWLGVGATITLVPLLVFNQLTYGVFLGPHVVVAGRAAYSGSISAIAQFETRRAWADLLLVPLNQPALLIGLLALIVLGLIARTGRNWAGGAILGLSGLIGLYILAIAPLGSHTSLLITCPLLVLVALPSLPAQRAEPSTGIARMCAIFVVVYIGLAWALPLPDGGSQWGPRTLLPTIPLLILLGLRAVQRWAQVRQSLAHVVAAALVVATLANAAWMVELRGLRVLRELNYANFRLLTTVAQQQTPVIVTDVWYAPPLIAPLVYDQHLVFLLGTSAEFDTLVTRLQSAHVSQFYYLGAQRDAVLAGSVNRDRLEQVGDATNLPHQLSGVLYRIPTR